MSHPTDDRTAELLERLADTFPARTAPLGSIVEAAHDGRRRRTRRNVGLAAAVVVLGLGGGVALHQARSGDSTERSVDRIADTTPACDKGDPVPPSEPIPRGPDYPTNAAGETYGSARDNSPQPDLLAAVGDCGRTGYIRHRALDEPAPWVPGAGSTEPASTPVYESDGVTQIDTFTQSTGTTVEDGVTDPPAPTDGPDGGDLEGGWTATIAGTRSGGKQQYDTYRDLDLWIIFDGALVRAHDGCQTAQAEFALDGGAFALLGTDPFQLVLGGPDPDCERSAPITGILENIRYVTQSEGRTYLHLANYRIAVVLEPAG